MKRGIDLLRAMMLVIGVVLTTRAGLAEGMALLVPAYFDPASGRWQQLVAAASRVPLVAIANVSNGPGPDADPKPEYSNGIGAVRAAGGQVIGYVYTQYGNRSLDVVKEDMRLWRERYSLDGFFVDEMSNDTTAAHLAYYAELLRYARELHSGYRVIGNPGTNTQEPYLKQPATDVVVIFENHTGYPAFSPSAWTKQYPATQFGHLPYAVATAGQMTNFVNLAVARRAGFIYVTDDAGSNPWDTLPSYWEAEVALLESINRAAAERAHSLLSLDRAPAPALTLSGQGAVGRYVLEAASPLGQWHPLSTNLTNTGTSVWQVLNLPSNRFFRLRQD